MSALILACVTEGREGTSWLALPNLPLADEFQHHSVP
jgi:hypothetical protein